MKTSLRLTGLVGLIAFGLLFGLTFGVPEQVEKSAKNFVKHQIEQEVKAKVADLSNHTLANKAKSLADKLGFQESQLKKDLDDNLPEKIASIMAAMCGYDCEKKKQFAQSIKAGYLDKIQNLQLGQINLANVVKGKYVEIVGNLKLDLRIFTFSNALMFMLLLLISILKPQAIQHLFVPGVLLFVATVAATSIYIFGQDWFYTIIYNDYMGFGYLVYLGIIFAFLMDIALNKCRITSHVFNFVGNAVSSIGVITPC